MFNSFSRTIYLIVLVPAVAAFFELVLGAVVFSYLVLLVSSGSPGANDGLTIGLVFLGTAFSSLVGLVWGFRATVRSASYDTLSRDGVRFAAITPGLCLVLTLMIMAGDAVMALHHTSTHPDWDLWRALFTAAAGVVLISVAGWAWRLFALAAAPISRASLGSK